MKIIESDIIIIGGGLTGLTLAYLLRSEGKKVLILEARKRLGGRIFTKYQNGFAPQEMGATWLGKQHTALINLLKELNLGVFEQKLGDRAIYEPISTSPPQLVSLPPNNDPSFRIKGGTSMLIQALQKQLSPDYILLDQIVKSIHEEGGDMMVKTETQDFKSSIIISTLPPFLLRSTIRISPSLPDSFISIASQTHTWMGESIKVSLTYKSPFWRAKELSGTIFSNVGPIPEMYDHSDFEDSTFALKGFLNGAYFSITKVERLELIMVQLEKYFGAEARCFLAYEETVWRKEIFTFSDYANPVLPHQNNGNPIFQLPYLNGKFYVAGAETANYSPGYMEGAVRSAQFVFGQIVGN
ncbi:MAG: FAD-dependent oxidoreductase [Bacteroidetes bacterium]|jgi:monoamine oxidase|nr:FAD-dependent oxidoreductase [Bacteroidota bacterium]